MPHVQPIEENEASPEVKEVFDDIKKLRQVEEVNNFWKYLANHPPTLKRTWESLKGDAAWSVGSSGQGDDLCSSECLQQL